MFFLIVFLHVDEQDEHVSVITNDPNRSCTASCGLQHIGTQRDVRLLMGDEIVKFVSELHVTLRGISTQDAGEEAFVLGILQDCFSAWEWCVGRRDGSPSILPWLASSSRGPSQLAHHHNSGQTAPVFGLLEGNGSV